MGAGGDGPTFRRVEELFACFGFVRLAGAIPCPGMLSRPLVPRGCRWHRWLPRGGSPCRQRAGARGSLHPIPVAGRAGSPWCGLGPFCPGRAGVPLLPRLRGAEGWLGGSH